MQIAEVRAKKRSHDILSRARRETQYQTRHAKFNAKMTGTLRDCLIRQVSEEWKSEEVAILHGMLRVNGISQLCGEFRVSL